MTIAVDLGRKATKQKLNVYLKEITFVLSHQMYVLGTLKNRLSETVFLCTHNISLRRNYENQCQKYALSLLNSKQSCTSSSSYQDSRYRDSIVLSFHDITQLILTCYPLCSLLWFLKSKECD